MNTRSLCSFLMVSMLHPVMVLAGNVTFSKVTVRFPEQPTFVHEGPSMVNPILIQEELAGFAAYGSRKLEHWTGDPSLSTRFYCESSREFLSHYVDYQACLKACVGSIYAYTLSEGMHDLYDFDIVPGQDRNRSAVYWVCGADPTNDWKIYLNRTDWMRTPPPTPAVECLRLADIDLDGDEDVIGWFEDGRLVWWRHPPVVDKDLAWPGLEIGESQDEPIEMGTPDSYNAGGAFADFLAVDIDRDGDPDVVVRQYFAVENRTRVSWWENPILSPSRESRGVIWESHGIGTVLGRVWSLQPADLDIDGDTDIVALGEPTGGTQGLIWFRNEAGPGLVWNRYDSPTSAFSGVPSTLAVGDIDRDGDPDVFVGGDVRAWYENLGGPTLAWARHDLPSAIAENFRQSYLVDVDWDGDIDVFYVSTRGNVWWVRNDTPRLHAHFGDKQAIATGLDQANCVHVSDLDRDTYPEVIGAAWWDDKVNIWWNWLTAPSPFWTEQVIGELDSAMAVCAVDLDGDYDLDLAAAADGLSSLVWWERIGENWLRRGIATAEHTRSLCPADVDGDGDNDLIASVHYHNVLRWYENDGYPSDGGWTAHDIALVSPWDVDAGDIDGDGDVDVVASANAENQLTWWEQSNAAGPPSFIPHGLANDVTGIKGIAMADVNRDGDLDILAAVSGLNRVVLWNNLGGNPVMWDSETLPGVVTNVVDVQAADLDRDNDLDVFAVCEASGLVVWWENQGPESKTPWRYRELPGRLPGARSITAADLDHNGMPDLVVAAGRPSNEIAWFPNQPYQYDAELRWAGTRLFVHQTLSPILELYVQHSGRDTQPEIALGTLRLRFRHVGGKAFTESELAALAESWAVYEDDGSGRFEPTDKALGTLVRGPVDQEGAATFVFPSDPSPVSILLGEARRFFVVVKTAGTGAELGEIQMEAFSDDLLRDGPSNNPLPVKSFTDVNSLFAQTVAAAPDLVPGSFTVPEQGQAGQPLGIQWEVVNRGNAGVSGEWVDRVFLSNDRVLDTNDLWLAEDTWQGFLESGAKYARSKAPLLPIIPGGDYYLILISDFYEGLGEIIESNNSLISSGPLRIPKPDLVPVALDIPSTITPGQRVEVSWTIENRGAGLAIVGASDPVGSWVDELYIGTNLVVSVRAPDPLSSGATYTINTNFMVPIGSELPAGVYTAVRLTTDASGSLHEEDESNNTYESGEDPAPPMVQIALADLAPTALEAPAWGRPGQRVDVSWTVRNEGPGLALGRWVDELYCGDMLVASNEMFGPLAAGTSYTIRTNFLVPASARGFCVALMLTTDTEDIVHEEDEANNLYAPGDPEVTFAFPMLCVSAPDLAVAAIEAPSSVLLPASSTVLVGWSVGNWGSEDAPARQDAWYLSSDPKLDAQDVRLWSMQYGPVPTGALQEFNLELALPIQTDGVYHLILSVDETGAVEEVTEANNVFVQRLEIRTATAKGIDLVPDQLVGPLLAAPQTPLDLKWSVKNHGTDPASGQWYDRVYLSRDQELGNDQALCWLAHDSGLAAGATYETNCSVTMPNVAPGSYYLIVQSDYYNHVQETGEQNNLLVRPLGVRVPDLFPISISASNSAATQTSIDITWTARNLGKAAAQPYWYDRVYISIDDQLGNDTMLGQVQWNQSLEPGSNYNSSLRCALPNLPPGRYYLILELDPYQNMYEVSETNNVLVRPLEIRVPELVPTALRAPYIADAGENIQISWDGWNGGNAVAGPKWYDRISLSKDEQVGNDEVFYQQQWTQELAPGSNYTSSLQFRIPDVPPGQYYLILHLDPYQNVHEVYETNNFLVRAMEIRVPDLRPHELFAPTVAEAGQRIQVSWDANNHGNAIARPSWYERVSLSKDQQAGNDEAFFQQQWTQELAPGSNYASSLQFTIPNVPPGQYYLILHLDPYQSVYEISETDNFLVRPIEIRVPELQPDTLLAPEVAETGQSIQVSWNASNHGNAIAYPPWYDRVSLSKDQQVGNDEAFFQQQWTQELAPGSNYTSSLRFTIPNVAPGNYYLILHLDTYQNVYEITETNNFLVRPIRISGPAPNLSIVSFDAPTNAVTGQPFTVSLVVSNVGSLKAWAPWWDTVQLGTNVEAGPHDILLSELQRTNSLDPHQSYTVSFTISNSVPTGYYYLHMETDKHYQVYESDRSNNRVSQGITFSTNLPSLTFFSGGWALPEVHFTSPEQTARVEYWLNDQLVGTAYAPFLDAHLAEPAVARDVPMALGANRFEAIAFDENGERVSSAAGDWTGRRWTTCQILEPWDGEEIYASGPVSGPVDILWRVRATQSGWDWSTGAPRVKADPAECVHFYVDGDLVHTSTNNESIYHEFMYHSPGLIRGPHVLRARVDPPEGYWSSADSVRLYVTNLYPLLVASRTVTQHSNWFGVTLQITNRGPGIAWVHRIVDTATGFQLCDATSSRPVQAVAVNFDYDTQQSQVVMGTNFTIPAGSTCRIEYRAVPVLFRTHTTYAFGGNEGIQYSGEDGIEKTNRIAFTGTINTPRGPQAVEDATTFAIASSDYLLVTCPVNLCMLFGAHEANPVLTSMARLATFRNGVLGYFNSVGRMRTGFRPADSVLLGNLFDPSDVREQLFLAHPEPDTRSLHCYVETGEVGNDDQFPFSLGDDFNPEDKLVMGRACSVGWPDYLPQIVVAKSDGTGFDVIWQMSETNAFDRRFVEAPNLFSPGDGIALGEASPELDPPQTDELVIADAEDGMISIWFLDGPGIGWSSISHSMSFSSTFSPGDFLAMGRLLPEDLDQIVVGDLDEDQLRIYGRVRHSVYQWLSDCSVVLEPGDAVLTGDVRGDALEEIIVLDVSDGFIRVYGWGGAGYGFTERTRLRIDFVPGDRLAVGRIGGQPKASILHLYGSERRGSPQGVVDIIQLGVGGLPGDRYDLDRLVNESGAWASRLAPGWPTNGFLLLVGEEGVVPAFGARWDLRRDDGHGEVNYTDRDYGSTSGEIKTPELSMGRIPGDRADRLCRALQTAIEVAANPALLDNHSAYCVSGYNRGVSGDAADIDFRPERRSIAAYLGGHGFTDVLQEHTPSNTNLLINATSRDVIFLAGHGSPESWDVLSSDFVWNTFVPGTAKPLVYVASCKTGKYPAGRSMAEAFLWKGASAYVGATEVLIEYYMPSFDEAFFDMLQEGRPLGTTMKNTVRHRSRQGWLIDRRYNEYICAAYHFYGDPKLGFAWTGGAAHQEEEPLPPAPTLTFAVPMFTVVETEDGHQAVEIPGQAEQLLIEGKPILPVVTTRMVFAPGQVVQSVTLKNRSEPLLGPALNLPVARLLIVGGGDDSVPASDPGWWPDRPYSWQTHKNPDGSTELRLVTFALQVTNASQIRFFTNFVFDIEYLSSPLKIEQLATDRLVYGTGAVVRAQTYVRNTGQTPIDVTLHARVVSSADGTVHWARAVPLAALTSLGWTRLDWESSSAPGGPYTLEVVVKDAAGNVLDEALTEFVIGHAQGRIAAIGVNPREFQYGSDVDLSATFANTGSTILDGILVILVQDAAGNLVAEFRKAFSSVLPGDTFRFDTLWTGATLTPRNCRLLAYAQFAGQTTAVLFGSEWENAPLVWSGTIGADGVIHFQWFSVTGRRYTIEFSSDVGLPFEPLTSEIQATPPVNTFSHHPSQSAGFYRLREDP